MRASRSTEVYAEFGAFYESQWIGHSVKVARDHYLQVREEDFERAVGEKTPKIAGKNDGKSDFPAMAKSFPAFSPAAQSRNALHSIEGVRLAKTADS